MIGTFLVAWILTWFNIDNMIVDGINQIFNTDYTVVVYWLIVFALGAIVGILQEIKEIKK